MYNLSTGLFSIKKSESIFNEHEDIFNSLIYFSTTVNTVATNNIFSSY